MAEGVEDPLSFVDHGEPEQPGGPPPGMVPVTAANQADVPTDEQDAVDGAAAPVDGEVASQVDNEALTDIPYVRIEQAVLATVRADAAAGASERGGLLLGWYDDGSDTVSITGSWPMERGERPGPFTPPAWAWEAAIDAADEAIAARGESGGIVGWYRGSAEGGVWMTPEAVDVHNERFGDRALVAMVIDPPSGEVGFFAGRELVPTRLPDWEIWSIEASRHGGVPATEPVGEGPPAAAEVATAPEAAVAATAPTSGPEIAAGRGFVARHRLGLFAALAALAGLLAGVLIAERSGDDGPRPPTAAEVADDLSFVPSGVPVASGRTGTVITFDTALRWAGERPPEVSLAWSDDDLGGSITPAPTSDRPGRYLIAVTPDVSLPAGPYDGAVVARRCPGGATSCDRVEREEIRQPFTIQIDGGSTIQVPLGLAIPDPDRMTGSGSSRSIPDELIITLDVPPDTADATALELARGTGATVIGGDRAGRVYQLRYPGTTERDAAVGSLDADLRVGTITLDRDLGAASPDPGPASSAWHLDALGPGLPFPARRPRTQLAIVGTGASLDIPALNGVGTATGVMPDQAVGMGTYAAGVACSPNSSGSSSILAGCSLSAIDVGATPPTSSLAALYSGVLASANTGAPVVLIAVDPDGGGTCGTDEPLPGDPRVAGVASVLERAMQVVDEQVGAQGRSVLWVLPAGDGCYSGGETVSARLGAAGFDNLAIITSVDQSGTLSANADAGDHIAFAAPGGLDQSGNGIPGPVTARTRGDRTGTVPAASMAAALFAEARAGAPGQSAEGMLTCIEDQLDDGARPRPPFVAGRDPVDVVQLDDTKRLTADAVRGCAVP